MATPLAFCEGTARAAPVEHGDEACLQCHAVPDLWSTDPISGRVTKLSIDVAAYRHSVHGDLPCRHCHDYGYTEVPHFAPPSRPDFYCIECHRERGDRELARSFDEHRTALAASVHASEEERVIDCHTCHDPHRLRSLDEEDVEARNQRCLTCHGPDPDPRQPALGDTREHHRWLPSWAIHLRHIRCGECHLAAGDATRHEIRPASEGERTCLPCHSSRSQFVQNWGDGDAGERLVEQPFTGDVYIIGATRSVLLDRLSFAGLGIALLTVFVHALARVVYWQTRGKDRER